MSNNSHQEHQQCLRQKYDSLYERAVYEELPGPIDDAFMPDTAPKKYYGLGSYTDNELDFLSVLALHDVAQDYGFDMMDILEGGNPHDEG
jgi:hypothetical protein